LDSVHSNKAIFQFENFYSKKKQNDSLIASTSDSVNFKLVEKYIPIVKFNDSYSDSTVFYYSEELNGVKFSFSRELDSSRRKKLFKVEIKYNANSNVSDPFRQQARQIVYEISKIRSENKYDLKDLVDRFKEINSNKASFN
jgi:hypothetical protein